MSELLRATHVVKTYTVKSGITGKGGGTLHAVDDVSFSVRKSESVGLVGESGCGKSTLGRCLLRLENLDRGSIALEGQEIQDISGKDLLPVRKRMQLIFQDPYSALNPRDTILKAVAEPLQAFGLKDRRESLEEARSFLSYVGLGKSEWSKYPHELSGGQRQRVVIARAMISSPAFVVCDEPVSALDASIRAQVLNLMKRLQQDTGVSYLFISHDLSVVRFLCTRILVMYLGEIIEEASREELYSHPLHPYTKALLSSIPIPDVTHDRKRILLPGELPDPMHPPEGCRFAPRCPYATDLCRKEKPASRDIGDGHTVCCHHI